MASFSTEKLLEMRGAGMTFSQIAAALGVSRNTVKSHCRRAGQPSAEAGQKSCVHCGQLFSIRGRRRFCSNTCRYAWNYQHRVLGADNAVSKNCECCGKPFFSYPSSHRKFCSRHCYTAGRYGKEACTNGIYAR